MPRKENWPTLMDGFFRDARQKTPEYGVWDCCLFPLAHADNITGSAFYERYKSLCSDAASAQAVLDGLGGLQAAMTELFGAPIASVKKAQRGDIVMYDVGQGLSLGVVDLSGTHFAIVTEGNKGFTRLRLDRALSAWRV